MDYRTKGRIRSVTDPSDKNEMAPESENVAPVKLSRRAMLRGTAAAMPIALTLPSGAALARSSNLISGTVDAPEDPYGNKNCLDASSVYPSGDSPHKYDMGDPPSADITALPRRRYYWKSSRGVREVDRPYMCSEGGEYFYKTGSGSSGRQFFQINKGCMVSLSTMTSLSGSILIKEV